MPPPLEALLPSSTLKNSQFPVKRPPQGSASSVLYLALICAVPVKKIDIGRAVWGVRPEIRQLGGWDKAECWVWH